MSEQQIHDKLTDTMTISDMKTKYRNPFVVTHFLAVGRSNRHKITVLDASVEITRVQEQQRTPLHLEDAHSNSGMFRDGSRCMV